MPDDDDPLSSMLAGMSRHQRENYLHDHVPWPEPVLGHWLLDAIEQPFIIHADLDPEVRVVCALYSTWTHAIDLTNYAPRLYFRSPTPGCGKTTTLDIMAQIVRWPTTVSEITRAALVDALDDGACVLVDEADHSVAAARHLRAVLNSGWFRAGASTEKKRGGKNVRCSTFGPIVFGGLGSLIPALMTRCITLHLEMSMEGLPPLRLDRPEGQKVRDLCRMARRWVKDNKELLEVYDPILPPGLTAGRQEDNWRMLLSIADIAGGWWPRRAREAAVVLSKSTSEPTPLELLIRDVKQVWGDAANIKSSVLVARLAALEGHPWPHLTTTMLAHHLKGFSDGLGDFIKPKQGWFGGKGGIHGYHRSQFEFAFARYAKPVAGEAGVAPIIDEAAITAAVAAARTKASELMAQRVEEAAAEAAARDARAAKIAADRAAREAAREKAASPATEATSPLTADEEARFKRTAEKHKAEVLRRGAAWDERHPSQPADGYAPTGRNPKSTLLPNLGRPPHLRVVPSAGEPEVGEAEVGEPAEQPNQNDSAPTGQEWRLDPTANHGDLRLTAIDGDLNEVSIDSPEAKTWCVDRYDELQPVTKGWGTLRSYRSRMAAEDYLAEQRGASAPPEPASDCSPEAGEPTILPINGLDNSAAEPAPVKRRPGRPKGSKNKPRPGKKTTDWRTWTQT